MQHVPFEDTANIALWARDRGYSLTHTLLFENEHLPDLRDFDWLVVLGGPMSIHEEDMHPWLSREKRFLRRAIDAGKIVLGICLGAQLVAEVLGGRVCGNTHPEIGWHEVSLTEYGTRSRLFKVLPQQFTAFHWHNDTFDLPPGATHTARSDACQNQAFELGNTVALQFHLESSMDSIDHLIDNCGQELQTQSSSVQSVDDILNHTSHLVEMRRLMNRFLDRMQDMLG